MPRQPSDDIVVALWLLRCMTAHGALRIDASAARPIKALRRDCWLFSFVADRLHLVSLPIAAHLEDEPIHVSHDLGAMNSIHLSCHSTGPAICCDQFLARPELPKHRSVARSEAV